MVAAKDFNAPSHPDLPNVRNLEVVKAMQSLTSKGYVKTQFSWQWYYYTLTPEGLDYLREVSPECSEAERRRTSRAKRRPRGSERGGTKAKRMRQRRWWRQRRESSECERKGEDEGRKAIGRREGDPGRGRGNGMLGRGETMQGQEKDAGKGGGGTALAWTLGEPRGPQTGGRSPRRHEAQRADKSHGTPGK